MATRYIPRARGPPPTSAPLPTTTSHSTNDTPSSYEEYRMAFKRYDINGDGRLDLWEIRQVFKDVGLNPTEAELAQITQAIDENGDGDLDFDEFVQVMEKDKNTQQSNDELETIEAYCALGGSPDKSGSVDAERIKKVISDFALTINIDELLALLDTDGSGEIEYDEFACLFKEETITPGMILKLSPDQQTYDMEGEVEQEETSQNKELDKTIVLNEHKEHKQDTPTIVIEPSTSTRDPQESKRAQWEAMRQRWKQRTHVSPTQHESDSDSDEDSMEQKRKADVRRLSMSHEAMKVMAQMSVIAAMKSNNTVSISTTTTSTSTTTTTSTDLTTSISTSATTTITPVSASTSATAISTTSSSVSSISAPSLSMSMSTSISTLTSTPLMPTDSASTTTISNIQVPPLTSPKTTTSTTDMPAHPFFATTYASTTPSHVRPPIPTSLSSISMVSQPLQHAPVVTSDVETTSAPAAASVSISSPASISSLAPAPAPAPTPAPLPAVAPVLASAARGSTNTDDVSDEAESATQDEEYVSPIYHGSDQEEEEYPDDHESEQEQQHEHEHEHAKEHEKDQEVDQEQEQKQEQEEEEKQEQEQEQEQKEEEEEGEGEGGEQHEHDDGITQAHVSDKSEHVFWELPTTPSFYAERHDHDTIQHQHQQQSKPQKRHEQAGEDDGYQDDFEGSMSPHGTSPPPDHMSQASSRALSPHNEGATTPPAMNGSALPSPSPSATPSTRSYANSPGSSQATSRTMSPRESSITQQPRPPSQRPTSVAPRTRRLVRHVVPDE